MARAAEADYEELAETAKIVISGLESVQPENLNSKDIANLDLLSIGLITKISQQLAVTLLSAGEDLKKPIIENWRDSYAASGVNFDDPSSPKLGYDRDALELKNLLSRTKIQVVERHGPLGFSYLNLGAKVAAAQAAFREKVYNTEAHANISVFANVPYLQRFEAKGVSSVAVVDVTRIRNASGGHQLWLHSIPTINKDGKNYAVRMWEVLSFMHWNKQVFQAAKLCQEALGS